MNELHALEEARNRSQWLLDNPASHPNFVARLEALLAVEATVTIDDLQPDYAESLQLSFAVRLYLLCEKLRDPQQDLAVVSASARLIELRKQLCGHAIGRYRLKLTMSPIQGVTLPKSITQTECQPTRLVSESEELEPSRNTLPSEGRSEAWAEKIARVRAKHTEAATAPPKTKMK